MSFVVGILMFVLVLICLFLILLVLVQLPKKDAGAGMAFGGGTADALFGAGSGNALTKITKWVAVVFLALSLVLGWLQSSLNSSSNASNFAKMLEQKQQQQTIPRRPSQAAGRPVRTCGQCFALDHHPLGGHQLGRPGLDQQGQIIDAFLSARPAVPPSDAFCFLAADFSSRFLGNGPTGRVGHQRKIVLKAWKKRAGRKITFKNGRSSGIF